MSLPYRPKDGSQTRLKTMAPTVDVHHHHRSTTKQSHKPFKPRFSSKGALKNAAKGKMEARYDQNGKRRTAHQQAMSKIVRRNQAKQLRLHHQHKREEESDIFRGKRGAPKHIAVVPLSTNIHPVAVIRQIEDAEDTRYTFSRDGFSHVAMNRFKRNLIFMPTQCSLLPALDICRIADWVLLVLSPQQEFGEEEDGFIRALEGQGITNVLCVVQTIDGRTGASKKTSSVTQLKREITRYFPAVEKVYVLENKADLANVVRILCTSACKGVRWRDARSWMLIEEMFVEDWDETDSQGNKLMTTATLLGTVRGKPLNPDRLVHVPEWGDCQIASITEINRADSMPDVEHLPSDDRDDLLHLAPEDTVMDADELTEAAQTHQGVLLDDHYYFSDDNSHIPPPPKRLPKGTSSYQAAWFLDNVSDSGSDLLDDEDETMAGVSEAETRPEDPQDGGVLVNPVIAVTEAGMSEHPESEMHIDRAVEDEGEDLAEFRRSRKNEAEDDVEFPDEIELHPNVLVRERLAKYRGLKSLRASRWDTTADAPYEPSEYRRLLNIADYTKSKNAAMREAFAGGVRPGTSVRVELSEVPSPSSTSSTPVAMFSLLRHEHKFAALNLTTTISSKLSEPIPSKEELLVQVGFRRLLVNPVFSATGHTANDVHKYDRFLHPGRTAVASFIGPLTWGTIPALVMKRQPTSQKMADRLWFKKRDEDDAMLDEGKDNCVGSQNWRLVGNATTAPVTSSRIIAKRVILTGHPFKIHKKLVTVRYMFFNKDDVEWFKALPLWTKRGRHGFIKESLGTHGYFKATFDGKVNPMDAVAISLYKRVWPRPARMWIAEGETPDENEVPLEVSMT